MAHHYYTIPTGKWDVKGAAVGFGEDQWIATLAHTLTIEKAIVANKAVLDQNDPTKRLGLYLDEWGSWYDPEPGTNPGFLVQRNTLRDALLAALHFHVFHAHADRVRMSNVAQMVNVLQAMIQTSRDRLLLPPTYHAFEMYTPFQDATSLPVQIENNPVYSVGATHMPGLSASAARGKDGKLWLGLVNVNASQAVELALDVIGEGVTQARGRVLTAAAMDAQNSFDAPEQVRPQPFAASVVDGKLLLKLPAKAMLVVALER